MRHPIVLLIVGSACLAVACGKHKNSTTSASATVSAPFITAADVAPGTGQNSPLAIQVVAALDADSSVYDIQPDAVPANPCASLLNELLISATATTATVGTVVDVSACTTQALPAGSTSKITSATAKVYFALTCTGADLSALNGKTVADLKGNKALGQCSAGTTLENLQVTVNGTDTAKDASGSPQTASVTVVDTSFNGKGDLSPCTVTIAAGKTHYDDSCIVVAKNDITVTVSGQPTTTEDYEKLTYRGLISDPAASGPVWYAGGQLGVTYDQWTGTLTYTSAAVAPTYKLTPTGGAEVSGSLVVTPSLALGGRQARRALQLAILDL